MVAVILSGHPAFLLLHVTSRSEAVDTGSRVQMIQIDINIGVGYWVAFLVLF